MTLRTCLRISSSEHIQGLRLRMSPHVQLSPHVWLAPNARSSPHVQLSPLRSNRPLTSDCCLMSNCPLMSDFPLMFNCPLISNCTLTSSPYVWWMQIRLPNPTMQPSLITPRTLPKEPIQGTCPRNSSEEHVKDSVQRFGQMEYFFLKSSTVRSLFFLYFVFVNFLTLTQKRPFFSSKWLKITTFLSSHTKFVDPP